MRSFFVAILAAAPTLSCVQSVVVPPAAPVPEVSMTPVHRSTEGMVLAHAHLMGWGAGPTALPAGAQMIILEGDPTRAEMFTLRLRLPNNYTIPPHYHPQWEHITVISGLFHIGMGDTFMAGAFHELRPGSFIAMRPGMRHFVHTVGETIVQLHAMGPWVVTYVNPTDDPRRNR